MIERPGETSSLVAPTGGVEYKATDEQKDVSDETHNDETSEVDKSNDAFEQKTDKPGTNYVFKKCVIIVTAFLLSGAFISFSVYVPHFVGMSIYKGDPNADASSEAYNKYVTGIEAGAHVGIIYYITFLIFSFFLVIVINKIGTKMLLILIAFIHGCMNSGLAISADINALYATALWYGVYRSVVTSIPYILMDHVAMEENTEDTGFSISVVASTPPMSFLVSYGMMVPLMEVTGSAAVPVYYAATCCFLGSLTFAALF